MNDQHAISSTSQQFLDIYDIVNDVLILKNGSTSIILTVNAMNFGLLAEQEQDTIIYSYAGLLNSINYPIQILIQSQTKDASAYLKLLEKKEAKATSQVKKAWIRRYSDFVSNLIQERNVLEKNFFVVIPASPLEMGLTINQNLISGFKEQNIEGIEKSIILEKAQNLLEPKRDHLIAQFNRIGLYARQLTTQEIIKLFYTNYNPEATEGQQITNSQSYTTPLVQAKIRGNMINNLSTATGVDPTTNDTTGVAPVATAPTMPDPGQNQLAEEQNQPAEAQPQPSQLGQSTQSATSAPVLSLTESPTIQAPNEPVTVTTTTNQAQTATSSLQTSTNEPVQPPNTTEQMTQTNELQANIDQAINQLNKPVTQ